MDHALWSFPSPPHPHSHTDTPHTPTHTPTHTTLTHTHIHTPHIPNPNSRAAGEADVPFFSISASEFVELYVVGPWVQCLWG